MKSAASRLAAEIVEIGQVRDSLARNTGGGAKPPEWTKSIATLRKREKSAHDDSTRFAAAASQLQAEIAKARDVVTPDVATPVREVKPTKPAKTDTATNRTGSGTDLHHQSAKAKKFSCPYEGTWIGIDLPKNSESKVELVLRAENGAPAGTYSKSGPGGDKTVQLSGVCSADIETLRAGEATLEI
jgi:hypothetical protein